MKKIFTLALLCLFTQLSFAQWTVEGTDVYSTVTGNVNIGRDNETNDAGAQLGHQRTQSGHAYFDLVAETNFPGFGTRLIRFGKGALKGYSRFEHRGNKPLEFKMSDNGTVDFTRSGNALSMRIDGSGNVGIGTNLVNNPNGYSLAVNGLIGSKEVMIENTSVTWPDYVFEENYPLMTLQEVETFINQHKHLPGVPSAAEVENQGGTKMGEMTVKMLEKIEELTLHVIEQGKRTEALTDKIEDLEQENTLLKNRLSELEKK